jgi:hypothetical protein
LAVHLGIFVARVFTILSLDQISASHFWWATPGRTPMHQLTIKTKRNGTVEAHSADGLLYRWPNPLQAHYKLQDIQANGWTLIYER